MRYRGEIRPAIRRGSIKEFFGSDPNLKGCWSLDGHARDESGNGNHGTVTGAIPYGSRFGRSYWFNNSITNYITVADSASIRITNYLTVMAWVRIAQLVPTETQYTLMVKRWELTGANDWEWQLINYAGTIYFHVINNSQVLAGASSSQQMLPTKDEILLVGTYDGSKIRLYVSGLLDGTASQSGTIYQSNLSLLMGAFYTQGIGYRTPHYGSLCESSLFSRVLSPAEISQYYQWAISEPRKYWYYNPVMIGQIPYYYQELLRRRAA